MKPTVKIVCDTVSDVPDVVAQELGITMVPVYVKFGSEEVRDRVGITMTEFLRRLAATREAVTTSQPSPGDFVEAYRHAGRDGHAIVSVQPSIKLSGTYQSACIARDLVAEEGIRVEVVDTEVASMSQGWAAIAAARAALEGRPVEYVLERVHHVSRRVKTLLTLDTLTYLQRNGRLGRLSALVGSLLHLKPILQLKDGELALADAAIGAGQIMGRLVTSIKRNIGEGARVAAALVHVSALDRAEQLREELSKVYQLVESMIVETGPGIAANVGPGGFGAMLYEID